MHHRRKVAIIVAGGSGLRMGKAIPKQFLDLSGKPVLYHSIAAFAGAYPDMEIVLVLPEAHFSYAEMILQSLDTLLKITLVKGGETRFHSVRNGLRAVSGEAVVFVHDGVRPLVSATLIHRCYEAALAHGSAVPVIDMKDSIREISFNGNTAVNREHFKIIQTPQTFLSELILPAFDLPHDPLFTDEATVVERLGHQIHLVAGDEANIKITKPLDLVIAEALMRSF